MRLSHARDQVQLHSLLTWPAAGIQEVPASFKVQVVCVLGSQVVACPMLCRDSYWILKGLLVSQMNTTAENMCFNLLSLLETYGHIPNGVW